MRLLPSSDLNKSTSAATLRRLILTRACSRIVSEKYVSWMLGRNTSADLQRPSSRDEEHGQALMVTSNMAVNTDAQARPLPSVAPVLVRRLPLR